jgi:tRNA(Arg) A34 adenosine deaminase TadA
MTHEDLLRRAIQLARDHSADGRHGPFGAVLVQGGQVVGEGWNQVVALGDPTAHAEVMAIRNACARLGTHDLTGATIYCSCEPCPMCLSAIYWARISRVFFAASAQDAAEAGFDDSAILRELRSGWGERTLERGQHLREEGRQVLKAWAENPAREEY